MYEFNLHFDDYDESGFLIKFGHKEHLEQIMNGKVRFTSLKTYQRIENKNIGDENEGIRTLLHQDGNLRITYCNPIFDGGREIDISSSIKSFKDFPNNNKYISCFSYLTQKTIIENNIISNVLLSEPEWDYVLLILDTSKFITDLLNILGPYNLRYDRVKYLDYSVNQTNDYFSDIKKTVAQWCCTAVSVSRWHVVTSSGVPLCRVRAQGRRQSARDRTCCRPQGLRIPLRPSRRGTSPLSRP